MHLSIWTLVGSGFLVFLRCVGQHKVVMNSSFDEINLPPVFRKIADIVGHERFLEI